MAQKNLIILLLATVLIFTAFSLIQAQGYNYDNNYGGNFPMQGQNLNALVWLIPIFIGFLFVWLALVIGIYVYTALALMAIAKKTKTEPAYLAWIPFANIYLASKIAGMPWWPMLLLIGFVIPILNIFFCIAFMVFVYIWYWKIFEKVGKPGWWILLSLIPFAGPIIFLVFMGIAAWSKGQGSSI